MPGSRDSRSIIAAAEQAAAAEDYVAAETLLREASLAQEASLGPLHPDLADTLNNLGIVCEINDHPDEAERCFRRAVDITTTVLPPDHPSVVTSRQNLSDFCAARGRSIEELFAPIRLAIPAAVAVPPPAPTGRATKTHAQPVAATTSMGPLIVAALGPGLMVGIIVSAGLPSPGVTDRVAPETLTTRSPLERVAAPPQTRPADPVHLGPTARAAARAHAVSGTSAIDETAPAPPSLAVVHAQLCATLSDWLCEPEDRPVPAGTVFFFTQVMTTSTTTIHHQWFRDNRLMLSVDLPIAPRPGAGYRSFSRYIMRNDSAGKWRIELRSDDGRLLYEERFSVQ
jgi:Protein of unknown function (DUF2914)/Tetratricopeptide repeat